jgi:hypothetical protein
MAGLCVPKVRLCVRARSIAGESTRRNKNFGRGEKNTNWEGLRKKPRNLSQNGSAPRRGDEEVVGLGAQCPLLALSRH